MFHIQNFASVDPAGTLTVRVRVLSAHAWSPLENHIFEPLCGVARVIVLFGRLILRPSLVPRGVRDACPTSTDWRRSPGLMTLGSAQPRTHLSQMPMWVGIDWKIGPECEPELIRSQKSTSESPPLAVS